MENKDKNYTKLLLVLIIILFIVLFLQQTRINQLYDLISNIPVLKTSEGITLVPTPTQEKVLNTNFTQYINNKYQFSFSYPDYLLPSKQTCGGQDTQECFQLEDPSTGEFLSVDIVDIKFNSIDDPKNQIISVFGGFGFDNGVSGFYLYNSPKSVLIKIRFSDSGIQDPQERKAKIANDFNQILTSFKFTDQKISLIKLYRHDSKNDPQVMNCNATDYVEKEIPYTKTPLKDAINLLIQEFIQEDEVNYGDRAKQFSLKNASIDSNGIATLVFNDPLAYADGGSCRIGIMVDRIINTASQFDSVKAVKITGASFTP